MPPKLLVLHVAALGWDLVERAGVRELAGRPVHPAETVFPALTCTVQASFRTAAPPAAHGMVANGLYLRELARPLFWEQSAALVRGARIWDAARAAGRTVGLVCWQQSLGEAADLVLSPKPVHTHHGGLIQDCYSQPPDLYADLTRRLGRPFRLQNYWGPLASRRSSEWIAAALAAIMADPAPDVLFGYLPHLDYDLQRHGPASAAAARALEVARRLVESLTRAAADRGYDWLVAGDYAMAPVTRPPVFPNRALREAGLFAVRRVKGMAYPDFFGSRAFALADHEVAHVIVSDPAAREAARAVLAALPGVGEVIEGERRRAAGLDHPRSGELVVTAAPGSWIAYPWWTDAGEAPDYARHVDIHNKPGYDPGELFFGWPPPSVSRNPARVRGTHGRAGPERRIAWAASWQPDGDPAHLLDLAAAVRTRLGG